MADYPGSGNQNANLKEVYADKIVRFQKLRKLLKEKPKK